MKEFNLEESKAGKPVCTRDGKKARIVCWDRKWENYPILALITENNGDELAVRCTNEGRASTSNEFGSNDLMMAPITKVGWVNIIRDPDNGHITVADYLYGSKEEAEKAEFKYFDKVSVTKIEWEE